MKTATTTLLLVLLLSQHSFTRQRYSLITVKNPADVERRSETIALSLKDVTNISNGKSAGDLVVMDAKTGKSLLSQLTSDELLFQSDFKPQEQREFIVQLSVEAITKSPSLVDGRFVLPREDYAWENDRIAFRMYGPAMAKDVSSGIDVWTKRVRHLIVDKWYSESNAAGKDTYHADHGEGADFFSVGKTLGAGGCGIWSNSRVLQPGVFSSYTTIDNGPIRTAFELTYTKWNIAGKRFTERKRISLDAGQNLNRIEVSFERLPDSLEIACGVVKRKNTKRFTGEKNGWVSLWGLTTADTVNGYLGTGVVLSPGRFLRFAEDSSQHVIITKVNVGEPFIYYSGAGWTRSGDFSSVEDWNAHLENFSRRLQAPLVISLEEKHR